MSDVKEGPNLPQALLVKRYVGSSVSKLQNMYVGGVPAARAQLALLRRQDPATNTGVLETLSLSFADLPTGIIGRGDDASAAEKAVAAAFVLYANHQQSKSSPMHVAGIGLGTAVRRLANPSDADSREKPVMRRFQALASSTGIEGIMYHLRGLVQQFRAADIPLDYAKLSQDLLRLQRPSTATSVRLGWARDLARADKKHDGASATGGAEAQSRQTSDNPQEK